MTKSTPYDIVKANKEREIKIMKYYLVNNNIVSLENVLRVDIRRSYNNEGKYYIAITYTKYDPNKHPMFETLPDVKEEEAKKQLEEIYKLLSAKQD